MIYGHFFIEQLRSMKTWLETCQQSLVSRWHHVGMGLPFNMNVLRNTYAADRVQWWQSLARIRPIADSSWVNLVNFQLSWTNNNVFYHINYLYWYACGLPIIWWKVGEWKETAYKVTLASRWFFVNGKQWFNFSTLQAYNVRWRLHRTIAFWKILSLDCSLQ